MGGWDFPKLQCQEFLQKCLKGVCVTKECTASLWKKTLLYLHWFRFRDHFNYITLNYCHKEVRNPVPVANLCLHSGITCPENWAFTCLNSAVGKTNSAVVKTKNLTASSINCCGKMCKCCWLAAARLAVSSAEDMPLCFHRLVEHHEWHRLFMMFFIVQIFKQKIIPVPWWDPLLGFTHLQHQKSRVLWGWCESCACDGLSLWFAEQLSIELAGSHGLRLSCIARRCGFGLRKIKWAPQVSMTLPGHCAARSHSKQKWWSWRGGKLQRKQGAAPSPVSGGSGCTLGPPVQGYFRESCACFFLWSWALLSTMWRAQCRYTSQRDSLGVGVHAPFHFSDKCKRARQTSILNWNDMLPVGMPSCPAKAMLGTTANHCSQHRGKSLGSFLSSGRVGWFLAPATVVCGEGCIAAAVSFFSVCVVMFLL